MYSQSMRELIETIRPRYSPEVLFITKKRGWSKGALLIVYPSTPGYARYKKAYPEALRGMRGTTFVCSICEETIRDQWWCKGWWGNNAWPVNNGRCCNACNATEVIPARIKLFKAEEAKEAEAVA